MSLESLRSDIDAVDRELVALLSRRAELALRIGEEKRRAHAGVHDPEREQRVLDHVKAVNLGPIDDTRLESLFRDIIEFCCEIQENAVD